jgi:hypothetical protein
MDDDDALDDDDAFHGTVASPSPSHLRRSPPPSPLAPQSQKRPLPPVKSSLKKKASYHKTKPPPEKLSYEKSKEESKAVAQKDMDN